MVYKLILGGKSMNKSIKILIVEDEAITARAIESELKTMGYDSIFIATTYNKALSSVKTKKPDLILLDINLNDKHDGIDLANSKKVFKKIPIIYITANSDEHSIEEMIATQASAYLSKPLKYEELKFLIAKTVLKNSESVDLGDNFTYDFKSRTLFHGEKFIKLSPHEKSLLEQLIKAKSKAIPSNQLESEIWIGKTPSSSSLRTLVGSLRKKLKELKSKKITNVPFLGYKLA